MSTQQPQAKRQRIDPQVEEEICEEIIQIPTKEREISQQTSTSSHRQEIERQHGTKVSSSGQQGAQPSGIKGTFMEIKAQNELLRIQLYDQFLKTTPSKQQRLMAAYDIKEEKMILSHFKPKVPQPQIAADYIKTNLEVLAKDIHSMDQIELHKQTSEMVYATLADKAMMAHQLKESLKNTSTQLDLEKMPSQAKDNKIKTLEEIIVELGHDPKDAKGIKALMKKKEEDIAALKKQLRLPLTMHPQATELIQEKESEEMMDLLMKMNQRIIQMERELEKAVQAKQGESTSQPPKAAPIVPSAPSTLTATIPPIIPSSTVGTSGTDAAAATAPESSMSMEEMIKAMKELEVQMIDLKEAKEKLAKLEVSYDKSKMTVAEKTRKIKAFDTKVKSLENELTLHKTLTEIKTILWAKIGQSITDQWQSIQTIHEQIELINISQFETQRARASLGNMPEKANKMIQFLNTHTKEQLAALDISSRTNTILTVKKVLTLRNFLQTLERKCQEMQAEINAFKLKFATLQRKGLPNLLTSSGKLLTHDQYAKRVNTYVSNQITASSSSTKETGPPSRQNLYDKLENLFYIEHEINHLFEVQPNFYRYC